MNSIFWALLTAIIWGAVPVIEKFGLKDIPVWTGLFYRCMGVIIGLISFVIFKFPDILTDINHGVSRWYLFVIGGLMASVLGQFAFYNALKLEDVSKVTPIAASYPLISFLLALILLKENFTSNKLAGIIFIIIGIVLLK